MPNEATGLALVILHLTLLLLPKPSSSSASNANYLEGLTNVLTSARRDSKNLYSSAFAAVTHIGCGDAQRKLQLQKSFSRVLVPGSVLDVDDCQSWLEDVAWSRSHRELPQSAHYTLFVLDASCAGVSSFIERANEHSLFSAPFKWLLINANGTTTSSTTRLLDRADLYPDSDATIWQRSDNDEVDRFVSIYKKKKDDTMIVEDRGYWNETAIVVLDDRVASRRRKNLGGVTLRSALVITNPATIDHLTDYQDRHIDPITKCNYPWALFLVEMLNATVSFQHVGTWGYLSANGSWGGMIGMLQRGEIDFGGTGTFLMKERIGVIQYLGLSTPTGSRFIFRRPPLSSIANLFKLPFRSSVWISIVALMMFVVMLLYPAMRLEWLNLRGNKLDYLLEARPPSLSDDMLVVFGAVSQQGSWYEARSLTCRIITLMALLAALSLYAAYTANIVALLQSTTTSINSLKDLLESPLTLAADDNVYNRYYFKSFKDPTRKAIYEERIEPRGGKRTNWLDMKHGVEMIRQGYFAFHCEPGTAYKLIQETYEEDEKCGFHEIDYLNVFDPHFIAMKRSPYLELLKVSAIKLYESGMRTRQLSRIYTKKPSCGSARSFLSVGLAECYGAFLALLYGLGLALLVLVAELIAINLRFSCKLSRLGNFCLIHKIL